MPPSRGGGTFESRKIGVDGSGGKVDTHINMLELKVVFFALQALLPQLKQQHIQFGIDNKTAVAYINKLGGTHSHCLTSLALEMWNFAADRKQTVFVISFS